MNFVKISTLINDVMVFSPPSTSKDCTFSLNKLSRTILILFSGCFSFNFWKIKGFLLQFLDGDNGFEERI